MRYCCVEVFEAVNSIWPGMIRLSETENLVTSDAHSSQFAHSTKDG